MHTVNFLAHLVATHQILIYWIIFIGLIFEGELIIICTGILAHLGAVNLWAALIFILLGALCKTILGYELGKYLFRKFNHNKFFRYIQKRVYHVLPRFKSKPFWSIFISKFIIGVNHLVIIFSGYEKINFRKYLKAEIIATIIWAPLFLSLGYIFSYTAIHVSHEIWRFLMVILVLLVVFVIFDKLVTWLYEVFEEFYNEEK